MATKKAPPRGRTPRAAAAGAGARGKAASVRGTRVSAGAPAVKVRTRKPGVVRRTTVYFAHEVYTRLRLYCVQRDQDLSSVVTQAVARFVGLKVPASPTSRRR